MTEYIESTAPPPEYADPKTGDVRAPTDEHAEQPPLKAQKSDIAYPPKPGNAFSQYETIDFLGNVSGGPHAAAAEALATFSSSVGDGGHHYMPLPPPVPPAAAPPPPPPAAAAAAQQPAHPPPASAQGPPFICPTCNTSYSRLEYLRRHERRHADIRPFVCPCGKSFSRSDVLARHKTKCRVVLASSDGSERKERTRGAPRGARTRGRAEPRRSDADDISDISVDPALAPVDPSLPPAPPPPLEDESLAYHQGVPMHYREKAYAPSKPAAPRAPSYAGAIHPELSARQGMFGAQEHASVPPAYAPGHYTPPEPQSRAQGANAGRYVSGGSLSYANSLNTSMSPYLSAFSCARDTPHRGPEKERDEDVPQQPAQQPAPQPANGHAAPAPAASSPPRAPPK